MKLKEQTKVLTAIVGSYPKPKYIYSETGRQLLDSFGFAFDRQEKVKDHTFRTLLDKAAGQAIDDQNQAGIDLVTDGEERRGHYVLGIVNHLGGVDSKRLKTISIRNGLTTRQAPRIVSELSYKGPIVVDEYRFTQQCAGKIAKVGLPGPSTVVDCVADEYYGGQKEKLAFAYARAIHHEVAALIEAGCRVIQFDDPVLLRYPDEAEQWGLKALETCFEGFENQATFIVHICRGYPNKALEKKGVGYKADQNYYRDILAWFSKSKLDAVSIEGAQGNLDLSVLPAIGKKTVMLGVLDVGNRAVESVEALVKRGTEALKYLPPQQLILAPDCGLLELPRTVAKRKLQNLAEAAAILNEKVSK